MSEKDKTEDSEEYGASLGSAPNTGPLTAAGAAALVSKSVG